MFSELSAKRKTIQAGHLQVRYQDGRVAGGNEFPGSAAIFGFDHLMTISLEHVPKHLAHVEIIINNQNQRPLSTLPPCERLAYFHPITVAAQDDGAAPLARRRFPNRPSAVPRKIPGGSRS